MTPHIYTNISVQDIKKVTHNMNLDIVNAGWTQQNSNPNTRHKNPNGP